MSFARKWMPPDIVILSKFSLRKTNFSFLLFVLPRFHGDIKMMYVCMYV